MRSCLWVSDESREEVPLNAGSIAALHQRLVDMLDRHGLPSSFNGRPNEIADAIPFADDRTHREYDRDSAEPVPRSARRHRFPSSRGSARASRARRARCISGGAASTSRSPASRAGRRRRIRAAFPACPTASRAKPTARKCRAPGFWAARRRAGRTILLQLRLSRAGPASDRARSSSGRLRRATMASSSCPMRTSARHPTPAGCSREFLQSTYDAAADLAEWDRRSARAGAGRAIEKGAADCSRRPSSVSLEAKA